MNDNEKANPPDSVVQSMFLAALTTAITSGACDPYLIPLIDDILKNEAKNKLEELIDRAKSELGL